jgi:hypothetical protein
MEMCWEDWIYDYEVLEPELRRSDWIRGMQYCTSCAEEEMLDARWLS